MGFLKSHKFIVSICVVLVVAALAIGGYFFWQYQQAQKLLQNPTLAAQQQNQALLAQVGRLIDLPKNEQPTIATVSDISKLKDQPFFANAQNGDKVLIYTNARKAILFRPSEDKIIDVAPVNIGPTPSPTPTSTPSKRAKSVTPTPAQ